MYPLSNYGVRVLEPVQFPRVFICEGMVVATCFKVSISRHWRMPKKLYTYFNIFCALQVDVIVLIILHLKKKNLGLIVSIFTSICLNLGSSAFDLDSKVN